MKSISAFFFVLFLSLFLSLSICAGIAFAGNLPVPGFPNYGWTEINPDAPWAPRAGLQVVEIGRRFFLIAGRTPRNSPIPGDSIIWGDVWRSDDYGLSWRKILADAESAGLWKNRAYYQAVSRDGYMYVVGGQNFIVVPNQCPPVPVEPPCPDFISVSEFFNDVWRSRDGIDWQAMTEAAPWEGRAGLSVVFLNDDLYVFAGSKNDDEIIIGGPPRRIYFNDVWKSSDQGSNWTQLTAAAPWSPRAGAVALVKDGWIYLLGGEAGFAGPYFNDVWRSRDGSSWQLVTAAAGWSPRPGHQCAVVNERIVCFGGFGLIQNPVDMWSSSDGANWKLLDQAPWNAASPDDIKYDFDILSVKRGLGDTIFTFGGDRERFELPPEVNVERVDNDVWDWAPRITAIPTLSGAMLILLPLLVAAAAVRQLRNI